MILKKLKLDKFRGIESGEIEFHHSFNLLVGVNGVGKSSVLDAVSILLSHLIPKLSESKDRPREFKETDITVKWPYLHAQIIIELEINGNIYLFECGYKKESKSVQKKDKVQLKELVPDDKFIIQLVSANTNLSQNKLLRDYKSEKRKPIAVFYSAHRALYQENTIQKNRSLREKAIPYAGALTSREFNLRHATELWLKEEELFRTDGKPNKGNTAINHVMKNFMEGFSGLRIENSNEPTLFVDKFGNALNLNQLSNGEKNILALVIDLTRRLTQANPDLDIPTDEGTGIVLIDELDLHLHPQWQSKIVSQLQKAFPKCQFVVTSHSPIIISSVKPESFIIMNRENNDITIQKGNESYGLNTNWILKHILGVSPRPIEIQNKIDEIEKLLYSDEIEDIPKAREKLDELKKIVNDDEIGSLETIVSNYENVE